MTFTKEQAKAMSILEVAKSLGMEMKRSSGQEYYWTQHDSFKINTRKNRFSWYSRDIHGDVINLVETIKGVSYKEAMHFLETGNFPEFVLDTTPKAPFEYRLGAYEEGFVAARDYLKKQRGLSDETIDFFEKQGVLAQARYRNQEDGHIEPAVVFKYFDQDKQIVGASLQGIVPDQERHEGKGYLKKILYNSDGLAGLSVAIGQPNRLVFTEAPIDLMSYYELHKDQLKDVRLVAMEGLKEQTISRYFMELYAQLQGNTDYRPDLTKVGTALETVAKTTNFFDDPEHASLITLAIDNDQAGHKFVEKLVDQGIKVTIDQPPLIQEGQKKMDWNEYLKQRGQEKMADLKNNVAQFHKDWEKGMRDKLMGGKENSFLFELERKIKEFIEMPEATNLDKLFYRRTSLLADMHFADDSSSVRRDIQELDEQIGTIFQNNRLQEATKKSLEETQGIIAETTIGDLPGNQEAAPLPEATISQPLNGLSPNQTQSQPLLQFTIKGLAPSTYKSSYHPITEKELRKLNRYAPNLQQVASWYLENLADSQLTYFYSDGKETGQVTVEFGKEHFMHLTGLLPQKEGQTAEQTLLDFVQGRGDFDHLLIANSGGAFDKLQVLPELQEVVESDAFYFNDLSSIEKLHRLDLDQAIRTADKDLLLALRTVDGTTLPASVMKLRSGLNTQLDQALSEKVILGVYQEHDGQITQLSINETYIKDGGQEMMAVMQDKYRKSERKQYDDVQVARQLDSDGDGISNEDEIRLGTDPHNANSRPGKEKDENQEERIDITVVSELLASNDTKGLSEHLRQGMRQYLNSDQYKTFLTAMSKFYNYSPQNIALILAQNPEATVIASYQKWQKDFGRQVQKGEKGLKIRVPMTFTLKDENGQPKLDDKGQEIVVTRFKLGTVFDVSQTQGKPLPRSIHNLEHDVLDYENLYRATRHVSEQNGVPISFEQIDRPNANGYFDRENKKIVLADKQMSEAQVMKTLFHEMAHSDLLENVPEKMSRADYAMGELQAESVAYIVASHFGIDTSDYSFAYLTSWARNEQGFAQFEAQLKVVQEEAKSLISRIDNALVLVKNKTLTQDKFQAKLNQAQAKQDSLLLTKEGQAEDLKKSQDMTKTLS
ncbi:PBECR4 domain-containing protein [Streptococcus sp. S784/96/1]|uniref:PBECR4 domain-containing protein n=1 Tax=Streptococcus sp. S784/96/1 TaxID=2653499 RepID=UPI00138701E3|nr:PBECR4 domain-containing protein [Streptococcus sp. S784/96/1]